MRIDILSHKHLLMSNDAICENSIILPFILRHGFEMYDRGQHCKGSMCSVVLGILPYGHIESFYSMLHSEDFQILFALYRKFLKDCRTGNAHVSALWLPYVNIVLLYSID